MVWVTPRAAPPVAAPPDPGPDWIDSVAGPESPDRIRTLLNRRTGNYSPNFGRGQLAAINGYYSRHLVPDIRADDGD